MRIVRKSIELDINKEKSKNEFPKNDNKGDFVKPGKSTLENKLKECKSVSLKDDMNEEECADFLNNITL